MWFELLTCAVGFIGGAIASVSGFGIGSTLTPLLTWQVGAKLAVAAVALPHAAGTALRFWFLRKSVDRHVLWTFGLMNAAGGLAGAVAHSLVQSSAVKVVFGIMLIFAGLMGLSGLAERWRFGHRTAWMAGLVAGGLGGFAGTQGGMRAAALLGFNLSKSAFVATSTAIGLMVDAARTPVYVATLWREMLSIWPLIVVATIGVLVGTLAGERMLRKTPEKVFRKIISALLVLLGASMVFVLDSGTR